MGRFAIGLTISALLAACAPVVSESTSAPPAAPAALAGGEWRVTAIDGQPVGDGPAITMTFADGQLSGSAGCNRYAGSAQPGADSTLKPGAMVATRMACPEPLMQRESRFLQALAGVTHYRLEDGALRLEGNHMSISAVQAAGEPFAGEWKIFEIGGTPIIADSAPTIAFADGRVSGAASCNRFMGSYTLADDGLKLEMSQMASTMMACADDKMQQEDRYLKLLAAVTGWSIDKDVLTLRTADGQTARARRGG